MGIECTKLVGSISKKLLKSRSEKLTKQVNSNVVHKPKTLELQKRNRTATTQTEHKCNRSFSLFPVNFGPYALEH